MMMTADEPRSSPLSPCPRIRDLRVRTNSHGAALSGKRQNANAPPARSLLVPIPELGTLSVDGDLGALSVAQNLYTYR
jgi:hypothetical protein